MSPQRARNCAAALYGALAATAWSLAIGPGLAGLISYWLGVRP